MSRKLLWISLVMVFAALACNAPAGGSPTDEAGAPTATGVQSVSTTAPQTPTVGAGTGQPTAVLPTPLPGADPAFIGPIQFTDSASGTIGGFAFAEGIEEVWAKWQYANMRDGLTVRRVWYLDGEVWVDRTVDWDFAKYGANGTINDVSIYDRDNGLPAGRYQLELYIDGRLQDIVGNTEDGRASFNVIASDLTETEFPSPSGSKTITISDEIGILLCDGCTQEIRSFHAEIVDVDWFPDERHILYTAIDRTEQFETTTLGLKWQLWVLDWDSGETNVIGQLDELYHDVAISPDGAYLAAAEGSGFADAGNIDLRLAFLSLDANYQITNVRYANEFGIVIPENMQYSVYPTEVAGYPLPGKWTSATVFVSPLALVGFESGFATGLYEFDMQAGTAKRIGDLP